jgi:hypothetical protein
MDREKRISDLLNQLSDANIPQNKDALDLIQDYFVNDEEETSDEENEDHSTDKDKEESESSDNEDDDAPHVSVAETSETTETSSDFDCENCCALPPFPTTVAATNFACKCTQIKVSTEENVPKDQRRGCISQFDSEVIVDFQLTLRGLNRGESASLLFLLKL